MAAISSTMMVRGQSVTSLNSGGHPHAHVICCTKNNQVGRSFSTPQRPPKHFHLQVKCMAKSEKETESTTNSPSLPLQNKESRAKFGELFAFSGAAPEIINGRLAMVGFVSALAVEYASGKDLITQVSSGQGVSWFVVSTAVLTIASLVPLFKGLSAQSQSQPIWSYKAEMWNGRFAMLGLVALAINEYVNGYPLV